MSKIADLYAEIGFKVDSIKLREVTKIIGDMNVASIIGATSLAALGIGIQKIIASSDAASTALLNFKEATGIDPVRAQQVDTYFQMYGAGAGEAIDALHKLNTLRLNVLQGKGDPQPFILTGLSPATETLKLLDQIHERFSDSRFLTQWAHQFAPAATSLNEMKQAWKEMIANQFGFSSDMLRGLDSSTAEWQKQFNIIALQEDQLKKNAEIHKEWVLAVNELNVEFQKTATELAPILIDVLKLVEATAQWLEKTKTLTNFFTTMARGLHNGVEGFGILTNFLKAGAMNVQSALSYPIINAGKLHNEVVKDWNTPMAPSKTTQVTVQTGPITVHARDPQDFVHKFDAVWKKEMMKDLQFGQQT